MHCRSQRVKQRQCIVPHTHTQETSRPMDPDRTAKRRRCAQPSDDTRELSPSTVQLTRTTVQLTTTTVELPCTADSRTVFPIDVTDPSGCSSACVSQNHAKPKSREALRELSTVVVRSGLNELRKARVGQPTLLLSQRVLANHFGAQGVAAQEFLFSVLLRKHKKRTNKAIRR